MLKPGKQSLYKKEAGHQRTGLKNHRFQVKNWSKSVTQRESRQSLELILLPLGSCCSSCCLCHSLIFQHSDLLLMLHTFVPNKAYAAHQSFFLRTSYGAKNLLSTGQSSISFRILFCASNTLTCLKRHEKAQKYHENNRNEHFFWCVCVCLFRGQESTPNCFGGKRKEKQTLTKSRFGKVVFQSF